MKIKLLLSLLILTTIGFAQSPINSFYGTNNTSYNLLTIGTALDHGTGGANQTWTFGPFVPLGTSVYTYAAPTTPETTTYPGTTNVIVTTSTEGTTTTVGKMFTKSTPATNTFSITGLTGTDLNINFSTNNATLGSFPMNYGFTNTDNNVAGTYTYTTYSGTFTGTLTTTVDAYGTLNLPGYGTNFPVTRLKTVLNISMNYSIFTGIGTVVQTSYSYYDAADLPNDFLFRSVTLSAVVPLLSINQSGTTLERFTNPILSNSSQNLQSVWVQNPVQNSIEINTTNEIDNADISVTDMLGKTIYQTKNQTISGTFEIPISLSKGIYLITIGNENGSVTKKIVKS